MKRKNCLGIVLVFLLLTLASVCYLIENPPIIFVPPPAPSTMAKEQLAIKRAAFVKKIKNNRYDVLIDYDLPITQERLWVFDRDNNNEIILRSKVSHAYNSGLVYARDLSNVPNTNKSCIGAFVTANDYFGDFGYSMRLHGLEKGINEKAFERFIVVHPNPGVTYSWGCFMTHDTINKQLVDLCKDGAFFYVHQSKK